MRLLELNTPRIIEGPGPSPDELDTAVRDHAVLGPRNPIVSSDDDASVRIFLGRHADKDVTHVKLDPRLKRGLRQRSPDRLARQPTPHRSEVVCAPCHTDSNDRAPEGCGAQNRRQADARGHQAAKLSAFSPGMRSSHAPEERRDGPQDAQHLRHQTEHHDDEPAPRGHDGRQEGHLTSKDESAD